MGMNVGFFGVIAITAALILLAVVVMTLMTAGLWFYTRITGKAVPRARRLQLIFGVTALVVVPLIITVLVVNS
ncbi:hypothetical protein [Deinococcus sp. QL22]|uniref:hypothetical protein n=1 Tax=Deinococcus sp. QL22 TaxID=2939437 RepID=UPI002016F67C|nr:hypothetical protein [Deinococcus sp. QL22]UQN06742.1 hypothetical protein M1R55_02130 [Deinococcus sp. QL22]